MESGPNPGGTPTALPLDFFVNKLFWPAARSAECAFALQYLREGASFDFKSTLFYRLRTGEAHWGTPGVANLPPGVSPGHGLPPYWVMPWDSRVREPLSWLRAWNQKRVRRRDFPTLAREFFALVDRIGSQGFDNSASPIKGHLLVRDDGAARFVYLDGNRRLGILAALCEWGDPRAKAAQVHVDVRGRFDRAKLWEQTAEPRAHAPYSFTREECLAWFDQVFF